MKFYQEKWAMSTMTNTWYDEDRRPAYKQITDPTVNDSQENPFEDVLAHHSYEQPLPDQSTRRNSSGGQSAAGSIDPDKLNDGKLLEDPDKLEETLASSPGSCGRERGSKFVYLAEID
ncbi:hypothetical protein PM082_008475 [Marasmius tenuissimus]|nr:hypothetical protein PM082_008475 [Marasmius tenuissimus]